MDVEAGIRRSLPILLLPPAGQRDQGRPLLPHHFGGSAGRSRSRPSSACRDRAARPAGANVSATSSASRPSLAVRTSCPASCSCSANASTASLLSSATRIRRGLTVRSAAWLVRRHRTTVATARRAAASAPTARCLCRGPRCWPSPTRRASPRDGAPAPARCPGLPAALSDFWCTCENRSKIFGTSSRGDAHADVPSP